MKALPAIAKRAFYPITMILFHFKYLKFDPAVL
jgi:hypothetical protein